MAAKRQARRGTVAGNEVAGNEVAGNEVAGNEAQEFVRHIRVLTETQFDFWVKALNRAAAAMQADVEELDPDEPQKTISYWYLLMYLLEVYAASRNPFEVKEGETWTSDDLVAMRELTRAFKGRFKDETVRRYVFDLKARGLIALDGRGSEARVRLTAPAIRALTSTIGEWVRNFRVVDQRVRKMSAI